jgi:hypothetical protein
VPIRTHAHQRISAVRRIGAAKPSNSDHAEATNDRTVTEASRRWAEFRLSVVGSLVVGHIGLGRLTAELKALSAKSWKHPITGEWVTFGYSTISRWYYIVLNNPKVCLRALSKSRSDTGIPRSITKQVRHYLAGQAKRHSSWSYSQHYNTLLQHMKEREWGRTPGYSTVRRYIKSLCHSQGAAANAEINRLEGLVAHLRRILIVESTINRLLRVPELRAKSVGPPLKFARLGPDEKAYVLARLQDYRLGGGSRSGFCSGVGISVPSIERWGASYRQYGAAGLYPRTRRKFPNRTTALKTKAQVLEIFHSQPRPDVRLR